MNIKTLGEFGLISRLKRDIEKGASNALVGIGDDTAVIEVGNELLLATCDAQIEGVHFSFDWFMPKQVGMRAAAVNLSDIAAMGGNPAFALVSIAIPPNMGVETIEAVYSGMLTAFDEWNVQIIGGNTAESKAGLYIDVALLGFVSRKNLLLRSGAVPGDLVCVTGPLGASAAGLAVFKKKSGSLPCVDWEECRKAYLVPLPKVRQGQYLGRVGGVSACIDISDGLLGDAGHIAERSGVTINIDVEKIPISATARSIGRVLALDPMDFALFGGEDFELLFTCRPERAEAVINMLEKETAAKAVVIGDVKAGEPKVKCISKGKEVVVDKKSFEHFSGLV